MVTATRIKWLAPSPHSSYYSASTVCPSWTQAWAPGFFHVMDLWYPHVILFSNLPTQNLHSSLTWTIPVPKQGNTFSPQPFTLLSAKNLPFLLSPAQLGLLFSSLNLIYFVKDRDSKPSSPLSNTWRTVLIILIGKWSVEGAHVTVLWVCPVSPPCFYVPISKGYWVHFLD